MTDEELENYQRAMWGLEGASSPLPPRWAERGYFSGQAVHLVSFDVEINVVSIVMSDADCGWEPVKAEPFLKRLTVPLVLQSSPTGGAWYAQTQAVRTPYFALDGKLPHTDQHTCWYGPHRQFSIWEPEDLKPLAEQIATISSEINLSSLLAYPNIWDERIFRFIPPKLMGIRNFTNQYIYVLARFADTADYRGKAYLNRIWGDK